MKISKRHLRQIIREEMSKNRINESIGVDTLEMLDSALSKAYQEIYSTHPSITGVAQWDARSGEAYEGDPHDAAVETIMEIVQDYLNSRR